MSYELCMLNFFISVQKLCYEIKCLILESLNAHLKTSFYFWDFLIKTPPYFSISSRVPVKVAEYIYI